MSKIKEIFHPLMNIKWAKPDSKIGFHFLSGINRPIVPSHVTKLSNSLSFMGAIRPVVCTYINFIDGVKRLYVLDGQHLINGLLRYNSDIPYIILPINDKEQLIKTIALLNSSSKPWLLKDYVIAWSSLIDDYRRLNEYHKIYDFEICVLASILSNSAISIGGGSNSRPIKNGDFKIVNEQDNIEILKNLNECVDILDKMDRRGSKYFCNEYVKFYRSNKSYNHTIFIKQLKLNKNNLVFAIQKEDRLLNLFNTFK